MNEPTLTMKLEQKHQDKFKELHDAILERTGHSLSNEAIARSALAMFSEVMEELQIRTNEHVLIRFKAQRDGTHGPFEIRAVRTPFP